MSKRLISGKRFRYRIKPHQLLQECGEYPQEYYKFRNEKVAKAFWLDSMGTELIRIPMKRIRGPKKFKL